MKIHIRVESMKAAEHLSAICKEFSEEMYLRSDKFCIDPKSTLGILAMMYSSRDQMFLDTGDAEESCLSGFLKAISAYMVQDDSGAQPLPDALG